MADNDDYEIQYYRYLEKIGMTPPNLRQSQTPQKLNNNQIYQRQLFKNSSQKKELNYQRINSIIVLNDQLEINISTVQNQSKQQNIFFNSEGKSPIFDIQTSLIHPNDKNNQKRLAQIDEFADESLQENSNKTNQFDSNIVQEQSQINKIDQQNLDFSSFQLKTSMINSQPQYKCNQEHQESDQSQQINHQKEIQDDNVELNKQENQLIYSSNQDIQNINPNDKELLRQNSPINIHQNENSKENLKQIETLQIDERIQNQISSLLNKDEEPNLQTDPQQVKQITNETLQILLIDEDKQQDQILPQQQFTITQEPNLQINQQEIVENQELNQNLQEIAKILKNDMDIEQIEQQQINVDQQIEKQNENQDQLIKNKLEEIQECKTQDFKNQNDKQKNDKLNLTLEIEEKQQIQQKLIEKIKKKQKKSRTNNKKKKRAQKKGKIQIEHKPDQNITQIQENIDVENEKNQLNLNQKIEEQNEQNFIEIKTELELRNPICNVLQQLIGGLNLNEIKINWNKYTFLKRKIFKKRSILFKSRLLI